MSNQTLEMPKDMQDAVARIMAEMKGMFPPHMRLTLVIRNASATAPHRDTMISEDNPDDVCRSIQNIKMMVNLTGGSGSVINVVTTPSIIGVDRSTGPDQTATVLVSGDGKVIQ